MLDFSVHPHDRLMTLFLKINFSLGRLVDPGDVQSSNA